MRRAAFILSARIEAAPGAPGMTLGKRSLPRAASAAAALAQRPAAALALYLPGSEPKLLHQRLLASPDAVILDLEDSVPSRRKRCRPILVRNTLRRSISDRASAWCASTNCPWARDLAEIVGESPDLILIPKVEEPEQVREVDRI